MGRIVREAVVSRGRVSVRAEVKVDSGADVTLIALPEARMLGLEQCDERLVAVGGVVTEPSVGRYHRVTQLQGPEFEVGIEVGLRRAVVKAMVPLWVVTLRHDNVTGETKETGRVPGTREQTLVGHDFLQAARAKLDYSVPHSEALSGASYPVQWPDWTRMPLSRAEERRLRKLLKCPKRRSR